MSNLMMRDQSRRQRFIDDKQEIAGILKKLLTVFAIFCAITSAYAIGSFREARSETYCLSDMPIKKVDRRLIGKEIRSYSTKISHKPVIDIGDVE
ncbi:MAG: hypothetical protein M0Q44_01135 [Methylobacter sp.]|jgi:hypothetical protein|nr:hypothetical protein [Methylobacter sp.]